MAINHSVGLGFHFYKVTLYISHFTSGLCSVLRSLQHSIGYMGDGFYRSKDPTNSIKVLKEKAVKENNAKKIIHTEIRNSTFHFWAIQLPEEQADGEYRSPEIT